jgi:hypothetical protein
VPSQFSQAGGMLIEKLDVCGVLRCFCSVGMIVWSPEIKVNCSARHIFVRQADCAELFSKDVQQVSSYVDENDRLIDSVLRSAMLTPRRSSAAILPLINISFIVRATCGSCWSSEKNLVQMQ